MKKVYTKDELRVMRSIERVTQRIELRFQTMFGDYKNRQISREQELRKQYNLIEFV